MSYEIRFSSYFVKEAKRLNKRYTSFADDLAAFKDSILENPLQGTELAPGIRKIRMAIKSKGKGTAGGARVITYNVIAKEQDGLIVFLLIYDKSDTSNVKMNVVKDIVDELGMN